MDAPANDTAAELPRMELAAELLSRIDAIPPGGTGLFLATDDIRAIAGVLAAQHETILDLSGTLDRLAIHSEAAHNLELIVRMSRYYLMNLVAIPEGGKVLAYMKAWIDGKNWAVPIEWPPVDMHGLRTVLTGLGYVPVDGAVRRKDWRGK